jgi:hypothetical protein
MTSQKFWLLQTAVQICMVKCHVQAAWTKYALQIQTVLFLIWEHAVTARPAYREVCLTSLAVGQHTASGVSGKYLVAALLAACVAAATSQLCNDIQCPCLSHRTCVCIADMVRGPTDTIM